jgi:hypothetical protein
MYNAGVNVTTRANHSLAPMIGREIASGFGENYSAIKRQYVVRYEDYDFSCSLTLDNSQPVENCVGASFTLTNSSGNITVHFDSGTSTDTDLYVDPVSFQDLEDWGGFIDAVVSAINGQFELQGGLLIDAYTHAASRPWVAVRSGVKITIRNNLQSESGFAITETDNGNLVFSDIVDFPVPDSKKKWFKAGDISVEDPELTFNDGFVNERLTLTRLKSYQDDVKDHSLDFQWVFQKNQGRSARDLEGENNTGVNDALNSVETIDDLILYPEWKQDTPHNQRISRVSVTDQERWFGGNSSTWSQLSSSYSHVGIETAIEKLIFTQWTDPTEGDKTELIENDFSYDRRSGFAVPDGPHTISGLYRAFNLNPDEGIDDIKEHRRGGWRVQDLYEQLDTVDVNDCEYSIYDLDHDYAGFLDEVGIDAIISQGNVSINIELPVTNDEKTLADNFREIVRSSRLDSEMLYVFAPETNGANTPWQPDRVLFRDESIYTNTGRTSDPSKPSQGIIYTNVAR